MSHQFPDTGAFNYIDQSAEIGEGTRAWHFCVVLANVRIGKRCNVGSFAEIGRGSVIGDDVRISSGVFLPSNSTVGNNVFLGPRCSFADDKHPIANNPSYYAQPPIIEDDVSVGMGAIILPGIRLGKGCRIGAGAIVTRDVPPKGHVRGEPAREKAYSGIHHVEFHELAVTPQAAKNDSHLMPS